MTPLRGVSFSCCSSSSCHLEPPGCTDLTPPLFSSFFCFVLFKFFFKNFMLLFVFIQIAVFVATGFVTWFIQGCIRHLVMWCCYMNYFLLFCLETKIRHSNSLCVSQKYQKRRKQGGVCNHCPVFSLFAVSDWSLLKINPLSNPQCNDFFFWLLNVLHSNNKFKIFQ